MRSTILLCLVAVTCSTTTLSEALGAEPLQSGLQAGEKITAIFEPLNVTGEFAGQPHCLVCENSVNPVAMVFARDATEPVLKLVAQLDKATAKHKRCLSSEMPPRPSSPHRYARERDWSWEK